MYVCMHTRMYYVCIKFDLGAGEMVQWLRALTVLSEDLDLIPMMLMHNYL